MFGDAVDNPFRAPPRWFNEGLAVYLSQGYDQSDRSAVEAAVKSGDLMPLTALTGQFPTDPALTSLAYAEAVSAVDHLVRTYGQDALLKLVDAYATGPTDDEAFTTAIGKDVAGVPAGLARRARGAGPAAAGPAAGTAGTRAARLGGPGAGAADERPGRQPSRPRVEPRADARAGPGRRRKRLRLGARARPRRGRARRRAGRRRARGRAPPHPRAMTALAARVRSIPSWQVTLGAALMALGFLVAAQIASEGPRVRYTSQERTPLVETALELQQDQEKLKQQVLDLRNEIQQLEASGQGGAAVTEDLNHQLQDARIAAGLVAMRGPGLVIRLSDSTVAVPPDANGRDYLVSGQDVLDGRRGAVARGRGGCRGQRRAGHGRDGGRRHRRVGARELGLPGASIRGLARSARATCSTS